MLSWTKGFLWLPPECFGTLGRLEEDWRCFQGSASWGFVVEVESLPADTALCAAQNPGGETEGFRWNPGVAQVGRELRDPPPWAGAALS